MKNIDEVINDYVHMSSYDLCEYCTINHTECDELSCYHGLKEWLESEVDND